MRTAGRRWDLVAASAVLALGLTACRDEGANGQGCEAPQQGAVQLCLDATDEGATGALLIGGAKIEGLYGGSEWEVDGGVAHGDPALPFADDFEMAEVDLKEQIVVAGDAQSVELTIGPLEADPDGYVSFADGASVPIAGGTAQLAVPPGDYLLTASGHWEQGYASYWFGLRVKG